MDTLRFVGRQLPGGRHEASGSSHFSLIAFALARAHIFRQACDAIGALIGAVVKNNFQIGAADRQGQVDEQKW